MDKFLPTAGKAIDEPVHFSKENTPGSEGADLDFL